MQNIPQYFSHKFPQEQDASFVQPLQEQLSTNGVVEIQTMELDRALNLCAGLVNTNTNRILLLNLNGCSNHSDAFLCLAEALQRFQAEKQFIRAELRQQPTLVIAFSYTCSSLFLPAVFPEVQWIWISNQSHTEATLHLPTPLNSLQDDRNGILDLAALTLPHGIPRQEAISITTLSFDRQMVADPRYKKVLLSDKEQQHFCEWLVNWLKQPLAQCVDSELPSDTTMMHFFALRHLHCNSSSLDVQQRSALALAKILYAWNQGSRALDTLESIVHQEMDSSVQIQLTLLRIKCQVQQGHWEQISILRRQIIQKFRLSAVSHLLGEFHRQLASVYINYGKQSQAEEELQLALRQSKREENERLRARTLRDIASLSLSQQETIAPNLLLQQVNCTHLSSADHANYLLVASDLSHHKEDKQRAEITLNQAESIDNVTPLSIANRQRRRATIALASGKYEAALALAHKACDRFAFCGEHIAQAHTTRLIADILACQGKTDRSLAMYKQSLRQHLHIRDFSGLQRSLEHLSVLLQHCESPLQQEVLAFISQINGHSGRLD